MGRHGPVPKKTTARATRRKMTPAKKPRVPALPKRSPTWLPSTRAWWKSVWSAPVAAAYTDADRFALVRLADLVDRFGRCPEDNPSLATKLAGEIRLAGRDFGLSPGDRERLRWDVAPEPEPEPQPQRARPKRDPRDYLREVVEKENEGR